MEKAIDAYQFLRQPVGDAVQAIEENTGSYRAFLDADGSTELIVVVLRGTMANSYKPLLDKLFPREEEQPTQAGCQIEFGPGAEKGTAGPFVSPNCRLDVSPKEQPESASSEIQEGK